MKLNIEVESGSFEKLIKEGIENLPKEELNEIIKQVVLEAFTKNNDMHGALITRVRDGSYYGNERVVLGPLAEAAVKNIDFGPILDEIKKKMLDDLRDNYREILENAILRCLLDKFTMGAALSDVLNSQIDRHVHETLEQMRRG